MKKERFEFKLDSADKEKAKAVLGKLGLTLSAYLTLSVRQLVIQEKVPFEMTAEKQAPTPKAAKVTENTEVNQPKQQFEEKPKKKKRRSG